MVYTTDVLPSVAAGNTTLGEKMVSAFSTPESAWAALQFTNTLFNALIGLFITLAVVVFFGYLLGWVIAKENSESRQAAIKGATRAMIALFLMVNIWSIFWMLNGVLAFSDVTASVLFIAAVLLFGFWSLFSLGDSFIRLLSQILEYFLDALVVVARKAGARSESAFAQRLRRVDQRTLRFGALVLLILIVTPISFLDFSRSDKKPNSHSDVVYAEPVIREPGDSKVTKNRYENMRYGISIEYPEEWKVSELSASSDGLVEGVNSVLGVHSQLNAGVFSDLATSSREAYLTALWRVEKNIHTSYATDSEGILLSETTSVDDIAGTNASLLKFGSYWKMSDESIMFFYDDYFVFGKGPVYFTLRFQAENRELLAGELNPAVEQVLKSIEISEPTTQ